MSTIATSNDTAALAMIIDGISGKNQIEEDTFGISSCGFSIYNPSHLYDGGGRAAATAKISPFTITRGIDASTPTIQQFCISGQHVDTACIKGKKSTGKDGGIKTYLKISFLNIYLTDYNFTMMEIGQESFVVGFEAYEFAYKMQDSAGNLLAAVTYAYNVVTKQAKFEVNKPGPKETAV